MRIELTTFSLQVKRNSHFAKRAFADITLLFKIHNRALNSFYPAVRSCSHIRAIGHSGVRTHDIRVTQFICISTILYSSWAIRPSRTFCPFLNLPAKKITKFMVSPRFELGFQDSKSWILTTRWWDQSWDILNIPIIVFIAGSGIRTHADFSNGS